MTKSPSSILKKIKAKMSATVPPGASQSYTKRVIDEEIEYTFHPDHPTALYCSLIVDLAKIHTEWQKWIGDYLDNTLKSTPHHAPKYQKALNYLKDAKYVWRPAIFHTPEDDPEHCQFSIQNGKHRIAAFLELGYTTIEIAVLKTDLEFFKKFEP